MNDNPKPLAGNPYADAVKLHQDHGNSISPAAQATLALAFEQRTRAFIELAALCTTNGRKELGAPMIDEAMERLGLGES